MSTEARGFAFLSLLTDEAEARALADRLESLALRSPANSSVFLVPGVRGLDFFASSASQPAVDRWWGRHVPPSAVPVYLLRHEPGLAEWLRGLDGMFLVAADRSAAAAYSAEERSSSSIKAVSPASR